MPSKIIRLTLMVDVTQVTKAMRYRLNDDKGRSIFVDKGRCANTFHFPKGSELEFELVVTANASLDPTISVMDMTLTSISTLPPGRCGLSMFDPLSACQNIGEWSVSNQHRANDEITLTLTSGQKLAIVDENGQWQVSGFLSLLIKSSAESEGTKEHARLFHFDPESTTGTGGDVE